MKMIVPAVLVLVTGMAGALIDARIEDVSPSGFSVGLERAREGGSEHWSATWQVYVSRRGETVLLDSGSLGCGELHEGEATTLTASHGTPPPGSDELMVYVWLGDRSGVRVYTETSSLPL